MANDEILPCAYRIARIDRRRFRESCSNEDTAGSIPRHSIHQIPFCPRRPTASSPYLFSPRSSVGLSLRSRIRQLKMAENDAQPSTLPPPVARKVRAEAAAVAVLAISLRDATSISWMSLGEYLSIFTRYEYSIPSDTTHPPFPTRAFPWSTPIRSVTRDERHVSTYQLPYQSQN